MKEKLPLVSIIVPVYNVAAYLEKCLQSIQQQTYENLQIIIIEDGSTDKSGEICDRFARSDKRICVYHTENRGLVAARKEGLKVAKGQYVGFVDGDDYIENIMYEKLVENMIAVDADFVHTGHIAEKQENKMVATVPTKILNLPKIDEKIEEIECFLVDKKDDRFIIPSIWSKLFKSEFIKKNYELVPDEQQYGEDVLCLFHCILHSKKISLLSNEFYHYIIREKSLSHIDSKSVVWQEIKLLYHMEKACDRYGEYSQKLKNAIFYWGRQKIINAIETGGSNELRIPQFYYDDIERIRGKKIVLYGAGNVGKDYYLQISRYQDCAVTAWVDKNYENIKLEYAKVEDIAEISKSNYDYVLIAIENCDTANRIKDELKNLSVPNEKVIWKYPALF